MQAIDRATAETLRGLLPSFGGAVGHAGSAVAGEERQLSWYAGLNSPTVPRYAVSVLLERASPLPTAIDLGTELLGLAAGQ